MKAVATAYGNNEQWHKAEIWMRKALELARTSPNRVKRMAWELAIELSVIMVQTDRESDAISLLTSTLQELNQPGRSKLVDIEISALAILAHAASLAKGPKEAEPVFMLALKHSEECYGKYSPKYANILGNYGNAWPEKNEARAKEILEGALQLKEFIYGPAHPSTTSSRDLLAKVLSRMGLHKDCLSLAKKNLRYSERYLGKNAIEALEIRSHLALTCENLYHISGRRTLGRIAEKLYLECLASMESIIGSDHSATYATRFWLANFLANQQRYDESIPLRRMELEVAVKQDGRESVSTLSSIHRLSEDLYWNDELEGSEQLYREALNGRIAALGDDDGATMASRYGLARCLSEQERYEEAIELRRIELAWCQSNRDVAAADMLVSMHGLGSDLLVADKLEEALDVLQECLKQRQSLLGQTHDDTLTTLARVLDALSAQGQERDAIALSQQAYQVIVEALGEAQPEALIQLSNQAYFHEELGELEQAETLYRRCLQAREQALGIDHLDTLSTAYSLADVLSQQERPAEAIPLRRRELSWCRQQNGDTDPGTLTSINDLAIDLRETGQLEEAEALFRELVAARQQVLEPGDFQIGRALGGLAKTLEAAGKLEEALPYSQQALDHRLTHEGPDAWWSNQNRLDLARMLQKLGRSAKALSLLDELLLSMKEIVELDDSNKRLIEEAEALRNDLGS